MFPPDKFQGSMLAFRCEYFQRMVPRDRFQSFMLAFFFPEDEVINPNKFISSMLIFSDTNASKGWFPQIAYRVSRFYFQIFKRFQSMNTSGGWFPHISRISCLYIQI